MKKFVYILLVLLLGSCVTYEEISTGEARIIETRKVVIDGKNRLILDAVTESGDTITRNFYQLKSLQPGNDFNYEIRVEKRRLFKRRK